MSRYGGWFILGTHPGGHCLHGPYEYRFAQRLARKHARKVGVTTVVIRSSHGW